MPKYGLTLFSRPSSCRRRFQDLLDYSTKGLRMAAKDLGEALNPIFRTALFLSYVTLSVYVLQRQRQLPCIMCKSTSHLGC